ncbi:DgyrCDS2144 [Dimorphilus gyrociliatus]|uniref:DgyrCDS2144 n=1 Tax=Dimorphilus gyrociliatus TaxID=2664684 RepID=A0A7I8V9D7_9ANNE|nr:DgyrCDS2144 [Dimorphilus gyrociliatus]
MQFRIALSSSLILSTAVLYGKYYRYMKKIDNLEGKYVLIIGCDSSIGFTTAKKLTNAGFKVIGTCLTENAEKTLQEEFSGYNFHVIRVDVNDMNSITDAKRVVLSLIDDQSALWAIINNVGSMDKIGPFDWLKKDDYIRSLDINFYGHLNILHTFLPLLKKSKGRIITNTTSEVTLPLPHLSPYCTSKMALEGLIMSTRPELGDFGIHSIDIQHGYIRTNMTFNMHEKWKKAWNESDHISKTDYESKLLFHKKYENLKKFSQTSMPSFLLSSDDVANCYLKAVSRKYPKSVYYLGFYGKLVQFLRIFSPNNIIRKKFVRILSNMDNS